MSPVERDGWRVGFCAWACGCEGWSGFCVVDVDVDVVATAAAVAAAAVIVPVPVPVPVTVFILAKVGSDAGLAVVYSGGCPV